jgi:hypothetical protein
MKLSALLSELSGPGWAHPGTLTMKYAVNESKGGPMGRGTITYPMVVGIRLTVDQAAKLHALATADDRPPSTLARRLVVEGLARYRLSPETRSDAHAEG